MNERLAAALNPAAVTIVGASARHHQTGYLLSNLKRPTCTFRGAIHLINRSASVIEGIQSVASTADLDAEPGMVVMLIPSDQCVPALEGFRRKPQGVIVYAGGAEAGQADAQEAMRRWAVSAGVPLFGPQSVGAAAFQAGLMSLIVPLRAEPKAGEIALVMQSAGLLGGTVNSCFQRDLGLHTAISIGNAVVVPFHELGLHLLEDPGVRALGLYLDAVQAAADLIAVAKAGQRLGKPIVLVLGGASEAGSLAVQSHTGQLATPRRVIEGIARQYGIILAADTDELVWSLEAIAGTGFVPPPPGGVALFASSGGAGIMAADVLSAAGVPLPIPSAATQALITERRRVVTFNPFDAGAASLDNPEDLRFLVSTLGSDPAYSMVVSVAAAGLPAREGMEAHLRQTTTFVDAVRSIGKLPFVAAPVISGQGTSTRPPASWPGVPIAMGIKEAASKLRALWLWANRPPLAAESTQVIAAARPGETTVVSGLAAQPLLRGLTARWPREVLVGPQDDAERVIAGLTFPLVAKAEAGLAHRAVSGGVLRGIGDPAAARAAVAYLRARFAGGVALIQEIPHDREYVIGFQRDERHGPMLMFGAGGSDVGRSVEFRALPLSAEQAALLVGPHAPDEASRGALAAAILSLQPIALGNGAIAAIDLNPVVVVGDEVVLLDAKVHQTR